MAAKKGASTDAANRGVALVGLLLGWAATSCNIAIITYLLMSSSEFRAPATLSLVAVITPVVVTAMLVMWRNKWAGMAFKYFSLMVQVHKALVKSVSELCTGPQAHSILPVVHGLSFLVLGGLGLIVSVYLLVCYLVTSLVTVAVLDTASPLVLVMPAWRERYWRPADWLFVENFRITRSMLHALLECLPMTAMNAYLLRVSTQTNTSTYLAADIGLVIAALVCCVSTLTFHGCCFWYNVTTLGVRAGHLYVQILDLRGATFLPSHLVALAARQVLGSSEQKMADTYGAGPLTRSPMGTPPQGPDMLIVPRQWTWKLALQGPQAPPPLAGTASNAVELGEPGPQARAIPELTNHEQSRRTAPSWLPLVPHFLIPRDSSWLVPCQKLKVVKQALAAVDAGVVRYLVLEQCDEEQLAVLMRLVLKRCHQLEGLRLECCSLFGGGFLKRALLPHCQLTNIHLHRCELVGATSSLLADLLASSVTLDKHDVEQGATSGLPLIQLSLTRCKVPKRGLVNLLEALATNRTVQHLNLAGTPLGTSGGHACAAMIKVNRCLRWVNISYCQLSADHGPVIAAAVEENWALRSLTLALEEVETVGARALVEVLSKRKLGKAKRGPLALQAARGSRISKAVVELQPISLSFISLTILDDFCAEPWATINALEEPSEGLGAGLVSSDARTTSQEGPEGSDGESSSRGGEGSIVGGPATGGGVPNSGKAGVEVQEHGNAENSQEQGGAERDDSVEDGLDPWGTCESAASSSSSSRPDVSSLDVYLVSYANLPTLVGCAAASGGELVREMALAGLQMEDICLSYMLEEMAGLTGVTFLDLANNHIGDEGAQALATQLPLKCPQLAVLDLSGNMLGDQGVRYLLDMVTPKRLFLDLVDNRYPLKCETLRRIHHGQRSHLGPQVRLLGSTKKPTVGLALLDVTSKKDDVVDTMGPSWMSKGCTSGLARVYRRWSSDGRSRSTGAPSLAGSTAAAIPGMPSSVLSPTSPRWSHRRSQSAGWSAIWEQEQHLALHGASEPRQDLAHDSRQGHHHRVGSWGDGSDVSESNMCCVCFDQPNMVLVKPCEHRLCVDCYRAMFRKGSVKSLCPFCRGPMEGFAYCENSSIFKTMKELFG